MEALVKELQKREGFVQLRGVSDEVIIEAEEQLGIKFAEEYKCYLKEMGIASAVGHEFMGLGVSGRLNVVEVTLQYRASYFNMPKGLYIIEDLGIDSILICQSTDGAIYQMLGEGEVTKIAKSMRDYLLEE